MSISRRGFVLGAGAALVSGAATESRKMNIRTADAIGVIRPELHGHFAEHLGSCIYGGVWVGRNSPVPNIDGLRKQAVEYLRDLGIPVLRWPGGCFADEYHWRDGIGPAAGRPSTVNVHWGAYTEDNGFGTHEFIHLCRLIGAQPYLAGNVGMGTPQELRDWMEYCNYASGSRLARERAANGSPEPFNVRYWGVGNESWGCGGVMTPEEYSAHYRRYSTFLGPFGALQPFLIAVGPRNNDLDWTRRFMETMSNPRAKMHGYAMHFYSRGKSNATRFTAETLREQLSIFADVEKAILDQRGLLDKYDPQRKVGLIIDEWGVWDLIPPEDEKAHGRLWQQSTMRSAVAAALGLNAFHRQADKVIMGNIAQTVNVLQSLLLAEGPHCVRTSTYYAFELLKTHRGKTSVRVESDDASPLGVSVSASVEGKQLVVSLANPKPDTSVSVDVSLAGASAAGAQARILHHADMNACNTFEQPDVVVPKELTLRAEGSHLRMDLPPLSVATAVVRLA